jgi:hypothetical protein
MARKASCCARRPKTSDPGVAKLVEAAASLSGVLGRVIEATVRARVFDLRLAIVLFGIFVVGGLDNGLDALLLLFR